jgi:broad specificity phosphatase PhoE
MKPNNIILIRHAQSEANADKDVLKTIPDHRLAITEQGRIQVKELVHSLNEKGLLDLPFGNHVYVSPFLRTRQTYQEFVKNYADGGLIRNLHEYMDNLHESPLIREQEWGQKLGEGYNYSTEKERLEYGMFYYRYPNGESGADVYQRVSLFLMEMENSHHYTSNVYIFTHGFTMKILLMKLLNLSIEAMESLATPRNCEYHHLKFDDKINRYELKTELRKRH